MHVLLTVLAEGEELAPVALPMPAEAFGITALVLIAVLLMVTFSFKNMAHRHDPKALVDHHDAPGGKSRF